MGTEYKLEMEMQIVHSSYKKFGCKLKRNKKAAGKV